MNIENYKKDIDTCRFCFMCRHVCSVARVTHEEEMTPRTRGLVLSMILRNSLDYTEEIADSIYQCSLCQYCKEWCEGGWDFPSAIRAARNDLTERNIIPDQIRNIKDSLVNYNNIFNKTSDDLTEDIKIRLNNLPKKTDNLLIFSNSLLYEKPEICINAIEILEKSNVGFSILEEEITSGLELYNLGYSKEAKRKNEKLKEMIKESGCKNIITLTGGLNYLLTEIVDGLSGIEIYHFTEYILELLNRKKIKFLNEVNKKVSYHDSNYMARYVKIIDPPREILKSIPALELVEMVWNKEKARSIGNITFMYSYPHIEELLVKSRLKDFKETGAELLITSSGVDKIIFERYLADNASFKVMDIVELIRIVME